MDVATDMIGRADLTDDKEAESYEKMCMFADQQQSLKALPRPEHRVVVEAHMQALD